MIKTLTYALTLAALLASSAIADTLPNYYPEEGFRRTGTLDDVQLERMMIVINDVPYPLSSNVVIHSPVSYRVPTSRLRAGSHVGYKLSGRLVVEVWLLPDSYKRSRGL